MHDQGILLDFQISPLRLDMDDFTAIARMTWLVNFQLSFLSFRPLAMWDCNIYIPHWWVTASRAFRRVTVTYSSYHLEKRKWRRILLFLNLRIRGLMDAWIKTQSVAPTVSISFFPPRKTQYNIYFGPSCCGIVTGPVHSKWVQTRRWEWRSKFCP